MLPCLIPGLKVEGGGERQHWEASTVVYITAEKKGAAGLVGKRERELEGLKKTETEVLQLLM